MVKTKIFGLARESFNAEIRKKPEVFVRLRVINFPILIAAIEMRKKKIPKNETAETCFVLYANNKPIHFKEQEV